MQNAYEDSVEGRQSGFMMELLSKVFRKLLRG